VYADCAREVGVLTPACETASFKIKQTVGGVEKDVDVKGLFVRYVEGTDLEHLDVGMQIVMKKKIARDRVLAALLGDHDRKMGNYLLAKNGDLVSLDHGMADLCARGQGRLRQTVLSLGGDAERDAIARVMKSSANVNHWRNRAAGLVAEAQKTNSGFKDPEAMGALGRRILAVEDQLAYEDVARFAEEVKKKLTPERMEQILGKHLSGDDLKAAVEIFRVRRDCLDEVLRECFKPLKEVSMLSLPRAGRRWAA
jgi:hypothetical protein